MQLSGSGDIEGAQLDRAGDERNFALRESEAFECDREGFGKVKTVSYHLSEFITQTGDITQAGQVMRGGTSRRKAKNGRIPCNSIG
jgi:hypothetical protein